MKNEVFEPIGQTWDLILLTIVMLILIGIVAYSMRYFKSKQLRSSSSGNKSRFVLLLLASTVVGFSVYSFLSEPEQVVIDDNSISTPYGDCKFDHIKEVEFVKSQNNEVKDSCYYLVIEEFSGKTHVLSENTYDIKEIAASLDKLRKK